MYNPKHLKLWTLPECYIGPGWSEYYVFLGQHRDSDSLTRSNFICGLREISGETETVLVVRERHWAVGWVEWIAIHKDDTKALELADQIMKRLEDYPVVNEDHWSDLEWNEAHDYWESMGLAERVRMCRDNDVSIFSARLSQPIPDVIYEQLRS